MGRAGILYSDVVRVATQLAETGNPPTVDTVRAALGGTGSKSTIAPYLKRWKAERQDVVTAAESGLPAPLLQTVKALYEHMQAEFTQQRDQSKQQHQAEMQTMLEREQQLRSELSAGAATNATLMGDLTRTQESLAQLQAIHHTQSVALAAVQAENTGLQQRLADRAAEVATLDHQLSQARAQFEHYQEATAQQRSEERQAYEQRIARLEHDLVDVHRLSAHQQAALSQQEAQLTYLHTEQARQEQALRAAQEDLASMRSARDRLADQLSDAMATKEALTAQLASVQQHRVEMQSKLAVTEREVVLLSEQLRRAEERAEHLTAEKLTWLQERGALEQQIRHATAQGAASSAQGE